MQPLATAQSALSCREIETSVFYGHTSSYDPTNLTHLIKDMAFINVSRAPSLDPSDSTERPTGRRTEPPPIGRAGDRRAWKIIRESALNSERRSPVSGRKPIVAGDGTDGHRHL